jgi:O-antigen/teichoic acid export membrane protein
MSAKVFRYGTVAFALAVLATPAVASFLRIEETAAVMFLWGMMLLSFFSSVASGTLSGWQKFGKVSVVSVANAATKLTFAVVFVWWGFGVSGIVGAFLMASIVGYGISVGYLLAMFRNHSADEEVSGGVESAEEAIGMKAYVLPVFFVSLAVAILGNIDMVLAKYHLDPDSAGAYGALFIVSKTIFFIGGILVSVMFAMSSEEHERSLRGNIPGTKTARKAFVLTVAFCIAAAGFFALFPSFVMSVFFGATYNAVSEYLWIFATASGLATLAYFFSQYLLAIRQTAIAYWLLAIAILEIPAVFVLGNSLESVAGFSVVFQGCALVAGAAFYWKNRKNALQSEV